MTKVHYSTHESFSNTIVYPTLALQDQIYKKQKMTHGWTSCDTICRTFTAAQQVRVKYEAPPEPQIAEKAQAPPPVKSKTPLKVRLWNGKFCGFYAQKHKNPLLNEGSISDGGVKVRHKKFEYDEKRRHSAGEENENLLYLSRHDPFNYHGKKRVLGKIFFNLRSVDSLHAPIKHDFLKSSIDRMVSRLTNFSQNCRKLLRFKNKKASMSQQLRLKELNGMRTVLDAYNYKLKHDGIRDVWSYNLEYEWKKMEMWIEKYPYIALDTEFPGILYEPFGFFADEEECEYYRLKLNVDEMKIIQMGITLFNEDGEMIPGPVHSWQFNFRFEEKFDLNNEESIDMLKDAGLDFFKMRLNGIEYSKFAEVFMKSGLVANNDVTWITFHGCFDWGYFLKLVLKRELPNCAETFLLILNKFFPNSADLKPMVKDILPLSSLQHIAEFLNIRRFGHTHQAASDSNVTGQAYFHIREEYFDGDDCTDPKSFFTGLAGCEVLRENEKTDSVQAWNLRPFTTKFFRGQPHWLYTGQPGTTCVYFEFMNENGTFTQLESADFSDFRFFYPGFPHETRIESCTNYQFTHVQTQNEHFETQKYETNTYAFNNQITRDKNGDCQYYTQSYEKFTTVVESHKVTNFWSSGTGDYFTNIRQGIVTHQHNQTLSIAHNYYDGITWQPQQQPRQPPNGVCRQPLQHNQTIPPQPKPPIEQAEKPTSFFREFRNSPYAVDGNIRYFPATISKHGHVPRGLVEI